MTEANPEADANHHNTHAQGALFEWQRIFKALDWDKLPDLLADDVTYSNPGDVAPLRGKEALVDSMRLSFSIFENFEYARQFSGEEGHVLEFRGSVGDVPFTGIDIIRFDDAGKVTDLVVMIRPVAAVMKLGEEAARRMVSSKQTPNE